MPKIFSFLNFNFRSKLGFVDLFYLSTEINHREGKINLNQAYSIDPRDEMFDILEHCAELSQRLVAHVGRLIINISALDEANQDLIAEILALNKAIENFDKDSKNKTIVLRCVELAATACMQLLNFKQYVEAKENSDEVAQRVPDSPRGVRLQRRAEQMRIKVEYMEDRLSPKFKERLRQMGSEQKDLNVSKGDRPAGMAPKDEMNVILKYYVDFVLELVDSIGDLLENIRFLNSFLKPSAKNLKPNLPKITSIINYCVWSATEIQRELGVMINLLTATESSNETLNNLDSERLDTLNTIKAKALNVFEKISSVNFDEDSL